MPSSVGSGLLFIGLQRQHGDIDLSYKQFERGTDNTWQDIINHGMGTAFKQLRLHGISRRCRNKSMTSLDHVTVLLLCKQREVREDVLFH